jgi:hypothetical protein
MRRAISAALLVALFLALSGCGGDETETATTTTSATTTTPTTATTTTTTTTTTTERPAAVQTIRIAVVHGAPKGGIVRATIDKGERVVLVVKSDVADEIHLHGYDLSTDVAAGGTARLRFRANVTGRFEVELESRSVQIADLTVQ